MYVFFVRRKDQKIFRKKGSPMHLLQIRQKKFIINDENKMVNQPTQFKINFFLTLFIWESFNVILKLLHHNIWMTISQVYPGYSSYLYINSPII